MKDVHVENAALAGLYMSGADVSIDNARVAGVLADPNGEFGDGGRSRVVEVDPRTTGIVWSYGGSPERPMESVIRSSQQRLANGNTLFEESDEHINLSDVRWDDSLVFLIFWGLAFVVFLQFFTRYVINDACVKLGIPWVYGAAIATEGRAMPILPGHGPCLRCIFRDMPSAGELDTCDTAGVLVVAEEFGDWEESKRRIDLLGLDRDATLVVIELKRTDDGGHMELQAIRYAADKKLGLDDVAYHAGSMPITVRDMIYGHQPHVEQGHTHWAHHSAWSVKSRSWPISPPSVRYGSYRAHIPLVGSGRYGILDDARELCRGVVGPARGAKSPEARDVFVLREVHGVVVGMPRDDRWQLRCGMIRCLRSQPPVAAGRDAAVAVVDECPDRSRAGWDRSRLTCE